MTKYSKGFSEEQGAEFVGEPASAVEVSAEGLTAKLKVGPGGRVVIPAEMRAVLDVAEGDTLVAVMDGSELKLSTIKSGLALAQAMVRKFVPAGRSLSEELLADRRREVEEERRRG